MCDDTRVACSPVHIDMRRHRGFSARLRKSHFVLASNPLPGTRPDDSSALLFFHVCQTWHLGARAHRCCQHVTIFSDTSHSQVRQSLSTRCRQPPWNVHTLFHSPVSNPSTFFPINFLKQLQILFAEAFVVGSRSPQELC